MAFFLGPDHRLDKVSRMSDICRWAILAPRSDHRRISGSGLIVHWQVNMIEEGRRLAKAKQDVEDPRKFLKREPRRENETIRLGVPLLHALKMRVQRKSRQDKRMQTTRLARRQIVAKIREAHFANDIRSATSDPVRM
ncbi:uncharacterized protein LOC105697183 isoform X1 [Orussus abietinus]|uniref:uncharacterized protein LOC105697183 isoform X1 n=1 Tax=Orussus abietinus TaxID=222816 RepID=UPI000626899F|nr:uncharacterized protein LOC105697183 isoform X1 [Orussus abietinus]